MKPKAKLDLTKVDVEDFLGVMEVENLKKATEKEFNFSCPFPGHQHGDQSPSAYMNIETTAWMCHGCKRQGNAITFLAEHENITFQLATRFLRDEYGGASPDPDQHSVSQELKRYLDRRAKQEVDRQETHDALLHEDQGKIYLIDWDAVAAAIEADDPRVEPYHRYMIEERGFHPETLMHWEVGYDPVYDRITIPVRCHEGFLRGFKGRAWNDRKPKYLILGGDKYDYPRYHKSRFVYGLYQALDWNLGHSVQLHMGEKPSTSLPEAIVCEGELNVQALWEMGFENSVAVAGSDLSARQAQLLRDYCDSATIFFDSDKGGQDGTSILVKALKDFMPIKVVPDHEHDPAKYLELGDRDSVRQLLDNAESFTKIKTMHHVG